MNRAIKYRAYPTDEQSILLMKTFGCCRKVWNLMLHDKIAHYSEQKKMLSTTPAMYKDEYPYLREVDSLALANVQLNLQMSYSAFFAGRAGFPKYKSRRRSKFSYTTNNQRGSIRVENGKIRLPKVGFVAIKIHREPKPEWKLKSVTVSMDRTGAFYISVLYEYDDNLVSPIPISAERALGLDYKSDGLYMDSNGNIGSEHKFYRESEQKLRRAQKKLSRMIKSHIVGSEVRNGRTYPIYDKKLSECANINKQRQKVAKLQRHAANQRLDFLHKKSYEIANQYDIVCVEDLDMKAMANKGFGNGKATMDNGYGMFLTFVKYKLEARGGYFIRVDKWYPSSQILHCHPDCRVKLTLADRKITCPVCGEVYDRDQNAAINIKNEGLRLLSA